MDDILKLLIQYKHIILIFIPTLYILSRVFSSKKPEKPKKNKKVLIDQDTFIGFELISKKVLTTGQFPVKEYRFKIEDDGILGLPIGQHIS
jgi:hypothetical protein